MKVVVNRCYGGFGISDAACEWLMKNRGYTLGDGEKKEDWETYNIVTHGLIDKYALINTPDGVGKYDDAFRSHPDLLAVIEALGKDANGTFADLEVVDVPDDVDWCIGEYDGKEWVSEKHRCW